MVYPLASLLATDQVSLGDVVSIDWDGSAMSLMFLKEAEGALMPVASPAPEMLTESAAANSGGIAVPLMRTVAAAERLPLRPREP